MVAPAATSLTSKIIPYALKGAGVLAAGTLLYDANHKGVATAKKTEKRVNADIGYKLLVNSQYSKDGSYVKSKLKDKLFNSKLSESFMGKLAGIGGYVKGFAKSLVGNIVPIALTAGALFGKGMVAKGSVAGLALYTGYSAISDIHRAK